MVGGRSGTGAEPGEGPSHIEDERGAAGKGNGKQGSSGRNYM